MIFPTSSSDLQAGEITYIDFAFVNRDKDIPSGTSIFANLYQGSTYLSAWYWDGIQQDHYGYVEDFEHTFSSGSHSIKNHVDPADDVTESNESDNIYQKSFVWGEIGDPDIYVSPMQIDINVPKLPLNVYQSFD